MSILNRILAAVETQGDQITEIINILNDQSSAIVGAQLEFQKGVNNMKTINHSSKAKGKMKFTLNDDGTATGTISFVDHAGAAVVPDAGATVSTLVTSSDPGVVVAVDTTGLIVTAAPASPLPSPLPQGVVVTATVSITVADLSVLGPFACDNSADPLNVTAGGISGAHITFA